MAFRQERELQYAIAFIIGSVGAFTLTDRFWCPAQNIRGIALGLLMASGAGAIMLLLFVVRKYLRWSY